MLTVLVADMCQPIGPIPSLAVYRYHIVSLVCSLQMLEKKKEVGQPVNGVKTAVAKQKTRPQAPITGKGAARRRPPRQPLRRRSPAPPPHSPPAAAPPAVRRIRPRQLLRLWNEHEPDVPRSGVSYGRPARQSTPAAPAVSERSCCRAMSGASAKGPTRGVCGVQTHLRAAARGRPARLGPRTMARRPGQPTVRI